ncbi:hypothetical protein BOTBODRAFT_100195 [Botryobasidium botryosum FD-172 SS1]|uniref:Initiator tRNA phosphoribosyl transferase n=1 Tax=Botryobasidium botryosum (strain FD-172 SS1) TaxID=930990 RepID=A0A067NB34_BOTB1|nr:hypothetical protein BOTBODRAFT_100195 [Botryobasidium botryosum FD-172 SS1]
MDINGLDISPQSTLHIIQKEKTDIYNRLRSIREDVEFVTRISAHYSHLPIVANQRCGAWYLDPAIASPEIVYFKSTDGHTGQWDFNLRRANLHLLPLIECSGGIIIVDSTRRGKRFPDALSKTIPIWCCVVNGALASQSKALPLGWNDKLYTSQAAVSRSEHSQMEFRVGDWIKKLTASTFTLSALSKPLRPMWLSPASTLPDLSPDSDIPFFPVICLSASKHVDSQPDGLESRPGFTYVQGSGDDHELWSQGLTPRLFWEHAKALLECSRTELPSFVRALVEQSQTPALAFTDTAQLSAVAIADRFHLGVCSGTLPNNPPLPPPCNAAIIVVPKDSEEDLTPDCASPPVIRLCNPPGKRGQHSFLSSVLPTATEFIRSKLAQGYTVLVASQKGDDTSLGIAIVALQYFFNEAGSYTGEDESRTSGSICSLLRDVQRAPDNRNFTVSKASIRKRLELIQQRIPDANPSRTTLKRVNEFLLTPRGFRRNLPSLAQTHEGSHLLNG